jgi:hypothetical protein
MKRDDQRTALEFRPARVVVEQRTGEDVVPEHVRPVSLPGPAVSDERGPRRRPPATAVNATQPIPVRRSLRRLLSSPGGLRQAMVLQAVLGAPAALRVEDDR